MSKILITSFEPFGLIGAWLRRSNTSADVMKHIQDSHGEQYSYLTLPTSDNGLDTFMDTLERESPAGIISLGEHLIAPPSHIVIEPHAYDTSVTTIPLKHLFSEKVNSDFVQKHRPLSQSSMIGGYYCNQVYLKGLQWAQENGTPPVTFVHTPVLGDSQEHARQVIELSKDMNAYIHTPDISQN